MIENLNLFPFNDLSESEFLSLLSCPSVIDLNDPTYYFDPLSGSDIYNSSTDPDYGSPFSNSDENQLSKYTNYSDLNISGNDNKLKIISQNIHSIPKNFEEFYSDICDFEFDIIALCETWTSNETSQLYQNLPGFNSAFLNRDSKGGGVGFYLKKDIVFEVLDQFSCSDPALECIFLNFQINNDRFIIGNLYRPPKGNFDVFNEKLSKNLTDIRSNFNNATIIILGDVNINILKSFECLRAQRFTNLMFSFELNPLIRRPTRVTETTASILDHIWTNSKSVKNDGIIKSNLTDHYPVFMTLSNNSPISNVNPGYKPYRKYSEANKKKFRDKLKEVNWEPLLADDSENVYEKFYEIIHGIYDECFPLSQRKITPKDSKNPFFNDYLRGLVKEKHRILKLFNRNPITFGTMYRAIRNKVNNAVRDAKRNYYLFNLIQSERNPKKTWEVLNEILGRNPNKNCNISKLITPNGTVTQPMDISNGLNNYFSSIGQDLNHNVPPASKNFNEYMLPATECKFEFTPVTEEEVIKLVTSLNNASAGHDGIPMFLYKNNIGILSKIITSICNRSLQSGTFPSELGVAKVTCIHKGGDKSNPANYRPISILSSFSKILEKLVEVRLQNYLESNNLFTRNQFGFRRKMGTENAIHSIVSYIHNSFNHNKFVLGVFLDVKKAFDSLDRNILLKKLSYYGISGKEWDWFHSYLSNRRQITVYDGCSSNMKRVDFGVPQGGSISPVLFLLYVNDMPNTSLNCESLLYADDTSLYFDSQNIDELFNLGNRSLTQYKIWFDANKLTLNAGKTNFIIFHRKQRHLPTTLSKLSIGSSVISEVKQIRFLGVIMDSNLSWNYHISSQARKLAKYVPIMYRARKFCTYRALKLIYNTLVYSNLIYCNSVWGFCKSSAMKPLKSFQKKILRAMANNSYPSDELFNRLELLNMNEINKYMIGIFVFKSLQGSVERNIFRRVENIRTTRSMANDLLFVPQITNVHSEQSINYRGPIVWNEIDLSTRNMSYDNFKMSYKSALMADR